MLKIKTNPVNWKDLKNGIEIDIPITEKSIPKFQKDGLTSLFNQKVTIYNDIPSDGVNPRRFDRFVIEKCNIQGGYVEMADGTIQNIVNATTIITKDVDKYKSPLEYAKLPVDEKEKYYTVQVNDVVIFGEVDDVATTRRELDSLLETKYKDNGFLVTAVNEYLNGMSVDNIQIVHA